jgi:hypothetical protein
MTNDKFRAAIANGQLKESNKQHSIPFSDGPKNLGGLLYKP